MRQGANPRRSRGRNNNGSNNNNGGNNNSGRRQNAPMRHQNFDSNGPDIRIRGNAFQIHEKYLTLARDANASGDRIAAENYLQHAEHYFRIMLAITEAENAQRGRQHGGGSGPQPSLHPPGDDDSYEGDEDDSGLDLRAPLSVG